MTTARPMPWRFAATVLAVSLAALLALYASTARSMADVWWSARGFTHGFLIAPISLWLVWRRRAEIARLAPGTAWPAAIALAAGGAIWLFAEIIGVNVGTQFALVLLVAALVWGLVGTRVLRAIAFPVGFLFFAVPAGEQLIPLLIEVTARLTLLALQISGAPVTRVGNYLRLPGQEWHVAEACSGLRYLLTLLTLSFLYAYLMFRSLRRRVLLILASVVVAIFANGFRAYMIVMIGFFLGSPAAAAADHIVYGWLLFALVAALFFGAAARWREDAVPPRPETPAGAPPDAGRGSSRAGLLALAALLLALAAVWPAALRTVDRARSGETRVALAPPDSIGAYRRLAYPPVTWRPHYDGARAEFLNAYEAGESTVVAYVGYYRVQRQGHDLVRSTNSVVGESDKLWKIVAQGARTVRVGGRALDVNETTLRSSALSLEVWEWYWGDKGYTASRATAKEREVLALLAGRGDDAAAILIAAPYRDPDHEPMAEARLERFVEMALPRFDAMLDAARAGSPPSRAR